MVGRLDQTGTRAVNRGRARHNGAAAGRPGASLQATLRVEQRARGESLPMPRRRRSVFASRPSYGRSAMWLEPGSRRRRGPRRWIRVLMAVLALAAAVGAVAYVVLGARKDDARKTVAQKWATAWAKDDKRAMWALLDADTKKADPPKRFNATYRAAERAATVSAVRTGKIESRGDRLIVP